MDGLLAKKELPFVLGVIADLAGYPDPDREVEPFRDRVFRNVDRDTLDQFLAGIGPRLALRVENKLLGDGTKFAILLRFQSLADFEPEGVLNQVEPLRQLVEARRKLSDLVNENFPDEEPERLASESFRSAEVLKSQEDRAAKPPASRIGPDRGIEADPLEGPISSPNLEIPTDPAHLLEQILGESRQETPEASRVAQDEPAGRNTEPLDLLDPRIEQVATGTVQGTPDVERMRLERIAAIDKLISDQLNPILHDPEFQRLESSWRGLRSLVEMSETSSKLQIRAIHATKKDLVRDAEKSKAFDHSVLFQKIYSDEYDVFGGQPYGALVGDYEFGHHPQDIYLLTRISEVAAAAHAPFLSAASPLLFGFEKFGEISRVRDLSAIFRAREYDEWKTFRRSDDSRYVCLCLPRMLLRPLHGPDPSPLAAFRFEEQVDGGDTSKFLWGNTAYALAGRLTEAFALHGWFASIRGVESGGLVTDLPSLTFLNDRGQVEVNCPTEVILADRRSKELADLGLVPLSHCKNTNDAAFFSVPTCHQPPIYEEAMANRNASLSVQLPYVLMTSRFAHSIQAIVRDKIGTWMDREGSERWLNSWIQNDVIEEDGDRQVMKSRRPLREARIEVEPDPNRPGAYRAIAYLRPNYLLEDLTTPLRLVVEMPEVTGLGWISP